MNQQDPTYESQEAPMAVNHSPERLGKVGLMVVTLLAGANLAHAADVYPELPELQNAREVGLRDLSAMVGRSVLRGPVGLPSPAIRALDVSEAHGQAQARQLVQTLAAHFAVVLDELSVLTQPAAAAVPATAAVPSVAAPWCKVPTCSVGQFEYENGLHSP